VEGDVLQACGLSFPQGIPTLSELASLGSSGAALEVISILRAIFLSLSECPTPMDIVVSEVELLFNNSPEFHDNSPYSTGFPFSALGTPGAILPPKQGSVIYAINLRVVRWPKVIHRFTPYLLKANESGSAQEVRLYVGDLPAVSEEDLSNFLNQFGIVSELQYFPQRQFAYFKISPQGASRLLASSTLFNGHAVRAQLRRNKSPKVHRPLLSSDYNSALSFCPIGYIESPFQSKRGTPRVH